jgi:hypothetical protein
VRQYSGIHISTIRAAVATVWRFYSTQVIVLEELIIRRDKRKWKVDLPASSTEAKIVKGVVLMVHVSMFLLI